MYKNRKGIQFGYRDTWSLDHSLSPIIHSALVKFRDVLEEKDWPSCPSDFFVETGEDNWNKDCEDGLVKFREALDKMIYAFGDNDPDILKYEFTWEPTENHGEEFGDGPGYGTVWEMECTNDKEHERYRTDKETHEARCIEGRELFGKYYHCLWW